MPCANTKFAYMWYTKCVFSMYTLRIHNSIQCVPFPVVEEGGFASLAPIMQNSHAYNCNNCCNLINHN